MRPRSCALPSAASRLTLALVALLGACGERRPPGPPPIDVRIEGAIKDRLAAARGSNGGVVLADDTPRADVPERPGEGSQLAFLRGASFHAPLAGLKGLSVAADEGGLTLRLDYGAGAAEILDSSGAPEEREFERLRNVGDSLWEECWTDVERQFAEEPAAAEYLARWKRMLPSWDHEFTRRFESPLLLRRFALQSSAHEAETDPEELYTACRLLRVKRDMLSSLGGEGEAYAVAAGPTVGVRRGVAGRDPEVRTALFGPDRMAIRGVATGSLPEPIVLEILNSFRPFARSRTVARRVATRGGDPLDRALSALSALHLDPGVESAVHLLLALKPCQPERRALAAALADWLAADATARSEILASAD